MGTWKPVKKLRWDWTRESSDKIMNVMDLPQVISPVRNLVTLKHVFCADTTTTQSISTFPSFQLNISIEILVNIKFGISSSMWPKLATRDWRQYVHPTKNFWCFCNSTSTVFSTHMKPPKIWYRNAYVHIIYAVWWTWVVDMIFLQTSCCSLLFRPKKVDFTTLIIRILFTL